MGYKKFLTEKERLERRIINKERHIYTQHKTAVISGLITAVVFGVLSRHSSGFSKAITFADKLVGFSVGLLGPSDRLKEDLAEMKAVVKFMDNKKLTPRDVERINNRVSKDIDRAVNNIGRDIISSDFDSSFDYVEPRDSRSGDTAYA